MDIDSFLALDKVKDSVRKQSANEWYFNCPVHGETEGSVHVTWENGKILLHCFGAECSTEAICAALSITLADLCGKESPGYSVKSMRGLTLEELAKAKQLPVDFLKSLGIKDQRGHKVDHEKKRTLSWGEILIPYCTEDGSLAPRHRRRFALEGDRRFAWGGKKEDGG